MSYCRFMEGDVYAYECDGGVQFYVADGKRELDRLCSTFNEAYQYARVLRDTHGIDVPSHAIEALKADAIEEAARICGPDGAVAELESENAELRELVKDMWQTISRNDGCGWDMDANCCTSDECTVSCRYWYRMKELGIEADDD